MNLVDIKKMNRDHVYRLIYQSKTISKQEIAERLGISVPTVAQCIKELEAMELVSADGFFRSTGGRKAAVISCRGEVKIALGVQILKNSIHMAAVDLYGNILSTRDCARAFENSDLYCACLGNDINTFFIDLNVPKERMIGVGIGIQGIVSEEMGCLTDGLLLNARGFAVERIRPFLPFPCNLQHDSEASAAFALWHNPQIRDTLYIMLGQNVGGAVVIDGKLHTTSRRPSGLIEHMQLYPDGRACYCGRKGCMDAYCSAVALTEEAGCELKAFFERVRASEAEAGRIWNRYLQNLATAIYNYQVILSTEVLLGGQIANFMNEADIRRLETQVNSSTMLADTFPAIYLTRHNDTAAGAAIYFIDGFLRQFDDPTP